MTPEQLRERADGLDRVGSHSHGMEVELLRAHAAALEEIERLNGGGQIMQGFYNAAMDRAERAEAALAEAERKGAAKQAEIDRLMLEFCPGEMTPEQLAEWGRHQRAEFKEG